LKILLQIKAGEDMHRQLCSSEYQENDFIFKWPNSKHLLKQLLNLPQKVPENKKRPKILRF